VVFVVDDDREVREAFAGSSRRSASRFSSAQEFLRSSNGNDLLRNDTDFNVAAFDRRSRGWCFWRARRPVALELGLPRRRVDTPGSASIALLR
jgi:hypothetical protein